MLVGRHGVGKSEIVRGYYERERRMKVVAFFLGQMSDPGDLIGLIYKDEPTGRSVFRVRHSVELAGRGGTSFAPVIEFLDEHRDYDGAIIFTDGCAPAPPRPKNRCTRLLWLFNREETYRRQHEALRALGRTAYLKEARATA